MEKGAALCAVPCHGNSIESVEIGENPRLMTRFADSNPASEFGPWNVATEAIQRAESAVLSSPSASSTMISGYTPGTGDAEKRILKEVDAFVYAVGDSGRGTWDSETCSIKGGESWNAALTGKKAGESLSRALQRE